MMVDMAAHVADIDVYHTDQDKSAYNHGLFWHTAHYVDADIATHRTYPSQARVSSGEHNYESKTKIIGGGPACGHLYATGLALTYFLTGNQVARSAAIELAQLRHLVRRRQQDRVQVAGPRLHGDGVRRIRLGQLSRAGTRLGQRGEHAARRLLAHGRGALPGEGGTADPPLHPSDRRRRTPPAGRCENRWFYTMFLQVLDGTST